MGMLFNTHEWMAAQLLGILKKVVERGETFHNTIEYLQVLWHLFVLGVPLLGAPSLHLYFVTPECIRKRLVDVATGRDEESAGVDSGTELLWVTVGVIPDLVKRGQWLSQVVRQHICNQLRDAIFCL